MKKATLDLRNMDCMDLMAQYPDRYFDLAIVDPPYGIGEDGRKTKSREGFVRQKNGTKIFLPAKKYKVKDWDNKPPNTSYFDQLKSIAKNVIIFGANFFKEILGDRHKPPRRKDYDEYLKKYPKGLIIWDKVNGNSDQADCEIIYTSFDFPSFVLKYMWAGFCQGKSIKSGTTQIGDKSKNEDRIHPTQKPVALYRWLLENYAQPGDKILDTHLGSGSIAIACHELGFDLTASELDTDYYNDMLKRVNKAVSQTNLFTKSEVKTSSLQLKAF